MAGSEALFIQFFLELLAGNSRFNAGLQIFLIKPKNPCHAPHIDRHNSALFPWRTGQSTAHIGATTIGHQADIMGATQFDDGADVLLALGVEN